MTRALTRIFALWIVWTPFATAATIQSVSKDEMTLDVKLSREELAQLPWRGAVLGEISSLTETFIAPLTIHELRPPQSTVILTSKIPLPSAKRLMTIQFLPLFWDLMSSPVLLGPSQLHSLKKVYLGGGTGIYYEALGQRREDRERRQLSRALALRFDASVPATAKRLGMTLGFEHQQASQDLSISFAPASIEAGSPAELFQTSRMARNALRPGLWAPLGEDLRFGLRVDYTRIETVTESGLRKDLFIHELFEPQIALTQIDQQFESTVFFKLGSRSKSTSASPVGSTMVESASIIDTPSELWVTVRGPTPALGLWGAGIGYIFDAKEKELDDATLAGASLPELLRAKLSLEQRLAHESKVIWLLQYEGGRSINPWLLPRLTNTVSMTGGYQRLWNEVWELGAQIKIDLGSISLNEKVMDKNDKQIQRQDKTSSLGTELMFYAQRPIELGGD